MVFPLINQQPPVDPKAGAVVADHVEGISLRELRLQIPLPAHTEVLLTDAFHRRLPVPTEVDDRINALHGCAGKRQAVVVVALQAVTLAGNRGSWVCRDSLLQPDRLELG